MTRPAVVFDRTLASTWHNRSILKEIDMHADKSPKRRLPLLLTLLLACAMGVTIAPRPVEAQQSCSADCTRVWQDFFCFKSCSVSATSVFCEDGSCTQQTYGLCLGLTWTGSGNDSPNTQRLPCGILSPFPFDDTDASDAADAGPSVKTGPGLCSDEVFHPTYTTDDQSEWALVAIAPPQTGVAAEDRMSLLAQSAGMSEDQNPDWRTALAKGVDYSRLPPELRAKLTGTETSLLVYPQQDSKLVYVDLKLDQFTEVKLPADAEGQTVVNVMAAPDGKILAVSVSYASDVSVGRKIRDAVEGLGRLPLRRRSEGTSQDGAQLEDLTGTAGVVNALSLISVYKGKVVTIVSSASQVDTSPEATDHASRN